jgi:hypothetical protein
MNRKQKNKIYTPGYFLKRLKDNNFIALRIFQEYGDHDDRRWTILVDPGNSSVFVTCFHDPLDRENSCMFSFDDGGRLFPRNTFIKTLSMEVIINKLISDGVPQILKNSRFIRGRELNSINERDRPPGEPGEEACEEAIEKAS